MKYTMFSMPFHALILCLSGQILYAQESMTIAVASSVYATMQQRVKTFEQTHHVRVRLISGSTGRLYHQIMQGAPFDVFIAADTLRPHLLLQQGKSIAQYDVGQGHLGIKYGQQWLSSPKQLLDSNIQHIGIANPEVAPFGLASKQVLQQQGLWTILKPKFVYMQNALQAAMLVEQGLVDAAFVPVTPAQPSMAVIPYIAVLLTKNSLAQMWLDGFQVKANMQLAAKAL